MATLVCEHCELPVDADNLQEVRSVQGWELIGFMCEHCGKYNPIGNHRWPKIILKFTGDSPIVDPKKSPDLVFRLDGPLSDATVEDFLK